jgi:hypothetical protein
LQAVLVPDFRILVPEGEASALAAARQEVGFLHRRSGNADYYLIANVSGRAHALRVQLAAGHRTPSRWDALTGVQSALAYEYAKSVGRPVTEVELSLEPFESCLVVFGATSAPPAVARTPFVGAFQVSKNSREVTGRVAAGHHEIVLGSGRRRALVVDDVPAPIAVEGSWTLRLGTGAHLSLAHLVSWAEIDAGFSGWGVYETSFDVPALGADVEWEIELGAVHETADVTLNGQALGAAWKSPRRLACGTAVRAGRNELRVEVANLWIHQMLTRPTPAEWKAVDETFGIRWGRYGETKPEAVPPSGLLGPVRLLPWKRVRVKV